MAGPGSLSIVAGLRFTSPLISITSATGFMLAMRCSVRIQGVIMNKNQFIKLIAWQHFMTLNINWIVDVLKTVLMNNVNCKLSLITDHFIKE